MVINTKEFQEVANKILLAADLDKNAANLELVARDTFLYLNVTNREYYVSCKFPLSEPADFHAVVDASLFLSLISGITTDTFTLALNGNHIKVGAGKSNYKLAMIYENETLMSLPVISIQNKTVEMDIEKDILHSILNVNSKELQKVKNAVVKNELQKLYYIDETGCFTFTTGACLNAFTLEKPVKLLLNERIVKLFKLFKENVHFALGQDPAGNGMIATKMVMQTEDTYLAALITCDTLLIDKVKGPCDVMKRYITTAYDYRLVLSVNEFFSAISRLQSFTKNNKSVTEKLNAAYLPVKVTVTDAGLTIQDKFENTEFVTIENGSYTSGTYTFGVNLVDLRLVMESCKNEHITFNCGDGRSIIISRGNISNLVPEIKL
jgi:DNA polymerase III sliding clamp (beta) subunit (PCNA family)